MPLAALANQSWDTWWHWNRHRFLKPQAYRVANPQGLRTEELTRLLIPQLRAPEVQVRDSATLAIGRVAGRAAVRHLLGQLDDPALVVRENAILALGTTGSPQAMHALMHIALHGNASRKEQEGRELRKTISSNAQPLAIVALGLLRSYGCRMSADGFVRDLGVSRKVRGNARLRSRQRDLLMAKLLYATLVQSEELQATARRLTEGEDTALELRSRALEHLSLARDRGSLLTLVRAARGHQLEARRSAILALGRFPSPFAVKPLHAAARREKEHLTRAFLHLALGQRGGEEAKSCLLLGLHQGPRTLRPWAALGLALWIRHAADDAGAPDVLQAIRQGHRAERNKHGHGAYLLALGLARDTAASHQLDRQLHESREPLTRMAAGFGLALLGEDIGRKPLREALATEKDARVRGALAEALGYAGKPQDFATLIRQLRTTTAVEDLPRIARAIGMLAHEQAYTTLLALARAQTEPVQVRAAAIQALGVMLSRQRTRVIARLTEGTNFTVFPGWLARVFSLDL